MLLGLARFPQVRRPPATDLWIKDSAITRYARQVHVKISAFFRVTASSWPYEDLAGRLQDLLKAFGSQRLMWGSDFPYVTEASGGYAGAPRAVLAWRDRGLLKATDEELQDLFSGTFTRLF
jgi:predicted TIM-barrel fold metal-dependent hydrolase